MSVVCEHKRNYSKKNKYKKIGNTFHSILLIKCLIDKSINVYNTGLNFRSYTIFNACMLLFFKINKVISIKLKNN